MKSLSIRKNGFLVKKLGGKLTLSVIILVVGSIIFSTVAYAVPEQTPNSQEKTVMEVPVAKNDPPQLNLGEIPVKPASDDKPKVPEKTDSEPLAENKNNDKDRNISEKNTPANNFQVLPETLSEKPRLRIMKSADKQVAAPKDEVSYQINIENIGSSDFTGAVIDQLAGGRRDFFSIAAPQIVSSQRGGGSVAYNSAAQQVKWAGSLEAGGSVMISYSINVAYGTKDGEQMTNFIIMPNGIDVECFGCTLTVEIAAPMLRISVTADREMYAPGETIHYAATIDNVGQEDYLGDISSRLNRPGEASTCWDCWWLAPGNYNTGVFASLDGEVHYGGNYFWWWGKIPAGKSLTLIYSARINDQVFGEDRMVTTVSATCCVDPEVASNSVVISIDKPSKPQLQFEMTANKQEARVGEKIVYEVRVLNIGQGDYLGAVTIDLSGTFGKAHYNYDAFSDVGGSFIFDTRIGLTWQGMIPAGLVGLLRYSVTVAPTADKDSKLISTVVAPDDVEIIGLLPTTVIDIIDSGGGGDLPGPGPGQCQTTIRVIIEWPFRLIWEKITICDGKIISKIVAG